MLLGVGAISIAAAAPKVVCSNGTQRLSSWALCCQEVQVHSAAARDSGSRHPSTMRMHSLGRSAKEGGVGAPSSSLSSLLLMDEAEGSQRRAALWTSKLRCLYSRHMS